jgi:hypothetical protein
MHRGLSCSKENVRIYDASGGCPSTSYEIASFSCGQPPVMTDLHAMTCRFYKLNEFE